MDSKEDQNIKEHISGEQGEAQQEIGGNVELPQEKAVSPSQGSDDDDDNKKAAKIQEELKRKTAGKPGQGNADKAPPAPKASEEVYVKEAERIIEEDREDPYKQEEDHEDLSQKYLKDRFGKNVKKE